MASSQSVVDFITEQMSSAGTITSRKMFGEFALYLEGKVIGFVCDNALFIKPTPEGKEFFLEAEDAPPYPGAKMYLLIPEEKWEDRDFMATIATVTFNALPAPIPKRARK